ncbi:MAG: hypothetical protein FWD23_07030 [Oscillospiraceae bacterium]|nr:hypothetical protein [Oscillospiraceae bacterium]
MKKLSIIMVLLVLGSVAAVTVSAENNNALRIESVEADSGKDEIYALKDKIVESLNRIISSENIEHLYSQNTHEHITSEDIDFNNMYKRYGNANEILEKNLTGRQAVEFFESCDYNWVMPISLGDITIDVILGICPPLIEERVYATDEDGNRLLSYEKIAELRSRVGRWQISSAGIDYLDTKYEDAITQTNEVQYTKAINDTLYYIFLPNLRIYAAFIATDDGNYINCFNRYLIDWMGKSLQGNFNSQEDIIEINNEINNKYMSNKSLNSEGRAGGISPMRGEDTGSYSSGDDNMMPIAIIVGAAAVLGGCLILYIRQRSKNIYSR